MSEYTLKSSPKVVTNNIVDEDFLSGHLGSLLIRQPMSPKSPCSNHELPIDFSKGPTTMRRHTSQKQMKRSKSGNNEMDSPRRNASATLSTAKSVSGGATTPEVTSPSRDDLFNSFFSTPKAIVTAKRQPIEGRSTFSLGTSNPGPASVSMSTSFGRKQKSERRAFSRTNSDKDSTTTSFSSLSQQQQEQQQSSSSRRASETTQPSNESGELEQSAPETPPEGMLLAPISSCNESEFDETQSDSSFIPASSSSASFGYERYNSPNEEETWQIFKEGGVIEPPEAIEANTIERKDVQNAKSLPDQRPSTLLGTGTSSSRYTSMTSSRFQSYRSTLSSVPTEMEVHNEEGKDGFVMDNRRSKAIIPQTEKANKTSITKQLAARSNSVTLVPSGDDGRTFVFVSRETENGDTV